MQHLHHIADIWSQWMVGVSCQLCLLVAVLLTLDLLLRCHSATIRYGLWSLVLLRLVLPPSFALPTGWGWWVLNPAPAQTAIAPTPLDSPVDLSAAFSLRRSEGPGASLPQSSIYIAESPARVHPSPATSATMAAASPVDSPTESSADSSTRSWGQRWGLVQTSVRASVQAWLAEWSVVLLLVYLGMVCAQFGMLFSSSLQVRHWASRARLICSPAVQALLDECRARVGITGTVELRDSESCTTPLVVGMFKPVILIPSTILKQLDRDELAAVLTHELQHIRRRDGMLNVLQAVLGVAYFFHPLVWLANSRIRLLREDVCDEFTLASLDCGAKPYGSALVKVAETLGYAAPPLAMGVLDGSSPLKRRLLRILDPRTGSNNPWGLQAFMITAAVALTVLPGGPRPVGAQSHDGTASSKSMASQVESRTPTPAAALPGDVPLNDAPPSQPATELLPPLEHSAKTPRAPSLAPESHEPPVAAANASSAPRDVAVPPADFHYLTESTRHLDYDVQVEASWGDARRSWAGSAEFELLVMNDRSVTTMFRPRIRRTSGDSDEWLDDRMFAGAHPQTWTRRGEPLAGDGDPLPLVGRSFSSLLLPQLPQAGEPRSSMAPKTFELKVPPALRLTLGMSDAPTRHPFEHFPVFPGAPANMDPWSHFSPFGTANDSMAIQFRVGAEWLAKQDSQWVVRESISQTSLSTVDGQPRYRMLGSVTSAVEPSSRSPQRTVAHFEGRGALSSTAREPIWTLDIELRRRAP
ncbi:MAG: M48 family metalloprotease [Planctomycetales bacterium]|nr:M48 family metalloprotease [Planctomycetales bacterium]